MSHVVIVSCDAVQCPAEVRGAHPRAARAKAHGKGWMVEANGARSKRVRDFCPDHLDVGRELAGRVAASREAEALLADIFGRRTR